MPNWAEGSIRIRGKRGNIIRFLQEELTPLFALKDDFEERPIQIEDNCGGWELILRRDPDTESKVYFKGSNRQFIEFDNDLEISGEFSDDQKVQNRDQVIYIPGFHGAWNVDYSFFKEKAVQHKVDVRIFVWERGMQWSSVTTWYRDGTVDETSITYANWLWDSPLPDYGG